MSEYKCTAGCDCKSFREHALGVSVSAHAMPTRTTSARPIFVDNADKQWAKDGEAYKRLRRQGLQPKDVDGCAHLEKHATDKTEIEEGKIIGKERLAARRVATDVGQSMGLLSA